MVGADVNTLVAGLGCERAIQTKYVIATLLRIGIVMASGNPVVV